MTKTTDQELLAQLSTISARSAASIAFSLHRCWEGGIRKRLLKLADKGLCKKIVHEQTFYFYIGSSVAEISP